MNKEDYKHFIDRRNMLIKSANTMSDYYDFTILFFCFAIKAINIFSILTIALIVFSFYLGEKSYLSAIYNEEQSFDKPTVAKNKYNLWLDCLKIIIGITFLISLLL
jgi:hypothetical protein